MSIATDLRATWRTINRVRRTRKFRDSFFKTLENRGPLPLDTYSAAIYFADTPRNIYQLRQWFAPFEALNRGEHKVVIISRSMNTTLRILEETDLPVHYAPTVADIESFMAEQPLRAVFYPNQNAKNFHCLRNHGPAHVWINHGESDKASMTTNQVKAYDYSFVAGEAAKERLRKNVLNFDVESRVVVSGRPQIDTPYSLPDHLRVVTDDRKVLFYSPTWEGDRPSMNYSSVLSHGTALINSVLNNSKYRLIFRPHPSTGNVNPEYRERLDELKALITDANMRDQNAGHLVDDSPSFGWQLGVSDFCVADVSAVAFDWLPTGKPILVTTPASQDAFIEENGLISKLSRIDAEHSSSVIEILNAHSLSGINLADLAAKYFGDTSPGSSLTRWIDAVSHVIDERTLLLENSKDEAENENFSVAAL